MRLLGPLLLLLLGAAGGWGLVSELSTRRQIDVLVDQQGTAVLQGIDLRLRELRQAKELNAHLLADEAGLPTHVEQRDLVEVSQTLAPGQAKLGVERVTVYTADGQELLNMGSRQVGLTVDPLVGAALAGHTDSTTAITGQGLAVLAATPVLDYGRIVGALIVGSTLDGDALQEISDRQGVELAALRDGRLIDATTADPDVARALRTFATGTHERIQLENALAPLQYRPTFLPLPDAGMLVALVSTRPLAEASDQRNLILLVGTIGLIVAVLAVGLVLARDIARPLENLVRVTRDLVAGDYQRRVVPSSIRELGELGAAVNHLAGELQRRVAELTHQALHDALTGLPNRTVLHERTQQAILAARPRPFAVLLLDLDRFKDVNDTLGHHAGDHLLQEVTRRLHTTLRTSDTVARLGGDEFAALLSNTDGDEASIAAGRLVEALGRPVLLDGQQVAIGASIGIALYPEHGAHAETLLRRADVAMYAAKQDRGTYVVYAPEQDHRSSDRLTLVSALRRAIAQDELVLHYQLEFDCRSGQPVGVEALVRWQDPQQGLISPDRFIPLAEQTGLVKPLTRWALASALRQCRTWRDAGLHVPVAVNLSAHDVQDPGLPAFVAELLADSGIPAAWLKVELTETALVEDPAQAMEVLTRMCAAGVRVAIDDFGTGYSSLAYLKQLPIHEIKIDRSFVRDMVAEPDDQAIVGCTIELAHRLGMEAVAEGVEDQATLELLRTLGCDGVQGYHLGRPVPAAELTAWWVSTGRAAGGWPRAA